MKQDGLVKSEQAEGPSRIRKSLEWSPRAERVGRYNSGAITMAPSEES